MTADPRDLPDTAELRRRGSLKWTAMPDADIAAWVAESDLGIAPAITAAVCDAVGAGLLGYMPPAVRRQLGEACAGWQLDRYGWQVDPARVHPVGDVREALRITIDQFSRPGSPVILPTPAYMPFVTAPGVWGREVIQVPMLTGSAAGGRAALDLDGIDRAFRAGGHLLVLVNPHNPTGRVLERDELLAVADVVERNGGRVFSDEIHAPLVHPGAHHIPYASLSDATAAHTVTATSASKAWNIPGLKCAQVVLSNAADAAAWARADILLTEGASTIGAVANSAAYTEAGPWLAEALGYLDGNRHALRPVARAGTPFLPRSRHGRLHRCMIGPAGHDRSPPTPRRTHAYRSPRAATPSWTTCGRRWSKASTTPARRSRACSRRSRVPDSTRTPGPPSRTRWLARRTPSGGPVPRSRTRPTPRDPPRTRRSPRHGPVSKRPGRRCRTPQPRPKGPCVGRWTRSASRSTTSPPRSTAREQAGH